MAERKSNRHFNLDKGGRKFDLSKPADEPVASSNSSESSKSKKWPWLALAGAALVGGGIYLATKSDNKVETPKEPEPVVAEVATPAVDPVAQKIDDKTIAVEEPAEEPVSESEVAPVAEVKAEPQAEAKPEVQQTAPVQQQQVARTSNSYQTPTGAIDEEVLNVLRGRYGCGKQRKEMLGDRYREIQDKVNEFFRNK